MPSSNIKPCLKLFMLVSLLWIASGPPNSGSVAAGAGSEGRTPFAAHDATSAPKSPTVVAADSIWKYLDNGSFQGTAWTSPDPLVFNDDSWSSGNAKLGYGDGDEATEASFGFDPNNERITTYLRHSFEFTGDPSDFYGLQLSVVHEDGVVVYLNGTEVFRDNMPGGPPADDSRVVARGADETAWLSGAVDPGLLIVGVNVLAAEIPRADRAGSNISFNLMLAETFRPNLAPDEPANSFPADLASGVEANPQLCVDVSDPEFELMDVTFYGRRTTGATPGDFTVVVLPEPQTYLSNPGLDYIYSAQTHWCVDDLDLRNVVFVTGLGDPVFHSENTDNRYELFSASGMEFIVFHLETEMGPGYGAICPAGSTCRDVIRWMDHLLTDVYPDRRAIIVTHAPMRPSGNPPAFMEHGRVLYDVLQDNPNVFLMVCGHLGRAEHRVDTSIVDGTPHSIYSVIADNQGELNGGNGWLRTLTFSPVSDTIRVEAYSPTAEGGCDINNPAPHADNSPDDASVRDFVAEGNELLLPFDMEAGLPFRTIGTVTGIGSRGRACVHWPGQLPEATYEWFVETFDGTNVTTGPRWSFISDGSCTNDADCDDRQPLTIDDRCAGGLCGVAGVECVNDVQCPDDGLYCNGTERCNLTSNTCESSGDPCAAGADCADTCNETAENCFSPVTTPCGDGSDTTCTDPDSCDGAGLCQSHDEPDGTTCDDSASCTSADACSAGICAGTDDCPGDQSCDAGTDICTTTVGLPTISVCEGGDLFVPITVDAVDDVVTLDLSFSYDPAVLSPVAVLPAPLASGFSISPDIAVPGVVSVALSGPVATTGGGTVAWVQFAVSGGSGSSSALQWLQSDLNAGDVGSISVDGQVAVLAAPSTLSLPDDAAGTPGGTVIVPIIADPAEGLGIDLGVQFDESVVQFVTATTTSISSSHELVVNLSSPGNLVISLFGASALTGTGSIVDLEFLVVGADGDFSPLLLTRSAIDEGAVTSCIDDGALRVCGSVSADDSSCDGQDDDCNGLIDDGYVPSDNSCGVGACAGNTGTLTCVAGIEIDSCDPFGGATADDTTCNDLDDDCDGDTDEDFATTPTTCGVGECAGNTGQIECQAGSEVDSCNPLEGAVADDQCDGLDNDCDGTNDDDYVPAPTTCGQGECTGNAGVLVCVDGETLDTCDPLAGALPEICDGRDNDCNGVVDDGPPAGLVGPTLRAGPDPTVLVWADIPNTYVYNVYRGSIDPALAFDYDHTCFEAESPDAQTEDVAIPPDGAVLYYLVSATNSCDGEDGLGTDSAGTPRPIDVACPSLGLDSDLDGIIDLEDNCPLVANPGQGDGDGDGVGDLCDNCPVTFPPDQRDLDEDGIGDVCDLCTDSDGDGFGDPGFPVNTCDEDNCPHTPNPAQNDTDSDGIGNVCDACSNDPENDIDSDEVCGDADLCPDVHDPDQEDFDLDGIGDACDDCTDTDDDGFGDPGFPVNTCDLDNCPDDDNPGQADPDGDGLGSACDICPDEFDPDQTDSDSDGLGNVCDACPNNPDTGCLPCPPGDDPDGDGACHSAMVPVELGSLVDYVANSSDPGVGLTWTENVFPLPVDWQSGSYGVGYDTESQYDLLIQSFVPSGSFSVYTRATFDVPNFGDVLAVRIGAEYDDAFVAWLNGEEIFRSAEMPAGDPEWNTAASVGHEASQGAEPNYGALIDVTGLATLQAVDNVLAVGVWNTHAASSDLVLVPQLTLLTSIDNCPDDPNPDQADTDGNGTGDVCEP
jgi:hypothetical protein